MTSSGTSVAVSLYKRHALCVTAEPVLHADEKAAALAALPRRDRSARQAALRDSWLAMETAATGEAQTVIDTVEGARTVLDASLRQLEQLRLRELFGKVDAEVERCRLAATHLALATEALAARNFGEAGAEVADADLVLAQVGQDVVPALNQALASATLTREHRIRLGENLAARREAKAALASARHGEPPTVLIDHAATLSHLTAEGFLLAASMLGHQAATQETSGRQVQLGRTTRILVIPPLECETFADVGGLEDVKQRLRATVGARVERPEAAERYRVVHNGILFHGPPGVGKSLLSRALAGEYGLRYLRASQVTITSPYAHESAKTLRRLFEVARDAVPCVLFLDEIDTLAAVRADQPSPEQREILTELMSCLEEYRSVPGLVIAAATNAIETLDEGLREGRFDARIPVGMPDPTSRAAIMRVHLSRRNAAVGWDGIDFQRLAGATAGCNGAALESIVSLAAQFALADDELIGTEHLVRAVQERGGRERASTDENLTWDDVILANEVRAELQEILNVFLHPDLAKRLGVRPPSGILLYGPPGTGKTTIAKAIAAQTSTSFYELSAGELVSKYVGESEQRVARLFTRARTHRPSIIFIDEIDALLRRRAAESGSSWEQRMVSQFFQELDGLRRGDGVLVIGATNRLEAVDEGAHRHLIPIEVGLPDAVMRLRLLQLLCRDVRVGDDVNLRGIVSATGGMSGADLHRVRDAAGMKALSRAAADSADERGAAITMADFRAALVALRARESLAVV